MMNLDPVVDANGQEVTITKYVPAGDKQPLLTVGVEHAGHMIHFTPTEALRHALDLFTAVTRHDESDPAGLAAQIPDDAGELEAVEQDLPEWDRRPNPWKPDGALQARAIELIMWRLVGTDADWQRVLLNFARDLRREQCAPAANWALIEYGCAQLLVDNAKRQTAFDRMRRDLCLLREMIRDEQESA